MLNDRERHALAAIEEQLRGSDPGLARLLSRGRPRRFSAQSVLFAGGVATTITGSALVSVGIAVAGLVTCAAAVVVAYHRAETPSDQLISGRPRPR